MPTTKPLAADDITHLLHRATRGRLDARARRAAGHFVDFMVDADALDHDALAAWVRAHLDDVAALARDRARHEVRHAAVFALGRSGDPRAAEPVLDALTADVDWCDHDFAFMAFEALGDAAVPTLVREADARAPRRRDAALAALGCVREVTLETLRALAPRHGARKQFLGALFNLHRAEVMGLALPGCVAKGAAERSYAVSVVHECVRLVVEEGQPWPARVPRDAVLDALAPLALDPKGPRASSDPAASTWGWAMDGLALLGDARAFDVALACLDAPRVSDAGYDTAVEVLGRFPARDEAWARLRAKLEVRDDAVRLRAAGALLSSPRADDLLAARDLAGEYLRNAPRGPLREEALSVLAEAPGGPELARSWIDPTRPRDRGTRAGLAAVVALAAMEANPGDAGAAQRERLDEITLPCDRATRRLVDEAWRSHCKRTKGFTWAPRPRGR